MKLYATVPQSLGPKHLVLYAYKVYFPGLEETTTQELKKDGWQFDGFALNHKCLIWVKEVER